MKEKFSVPYVAAIIERKRDGKTEILMQRRSKPSYDPKYTGAYEIPAGRIREFESVFDALRREVKEETGLNLSKIGGRKLNESVTKGDRTFAFIPFCCAQLVKGPHPYIGFYFTCEAYGKIRRSRESARHEWIAADRLELMLKDRKNFYILHVAALKIYLGKKSK